MPPEVLSARLLAENDPEELKRIRKLPHEKEGGELVHYTDHGGKRCEEVRAQLASFLRLVDLEPIGRTDPSLIRSARIWFGQPIADLVEDRIGGALKLSQDISKKAISPEDVAWVQRNIPEKAAALEQYSKVQNQPAAKLAPPPEPIQGLISQSASLTDPALASRFFDNAKKAGQEQALSGVDLTYERSREHELLEARQEFEAPDVPIPSSRRRGDDASDHGPMGAAGGATLGAALAIAAKRRKEEVLLASLGTAGALYAGAAVYDTQVSQIPIVDSQKPGDPIPVSIDKPNIRPTPDKAPNDTIAHPISESDVPLNAHTESEVPEPTAIHPKPDKDQDLAIRNDPTVMVKPYADEESKKHILGNHRPGASVPEKSEFPPGWSDEKIIELVVEVANDPKSKVELQDNARFGIEGIREGVKIFVVVDGPRHRTPGRIVTAFPKTNTPRNP